MIAQCARQRYRAIRSVHAPLAGVDRYVQILKNEEGNFAKSSVTQQRIVRFISPHLTLLKRAIAVAFLSLCLSVRPSVKRVDCDKMK